MSLSAWNRIHGQLRQPVSKFPIRYETHRITTELTRSHHRSLFWVSWNSPHSRTMWLQCELIIVHGILSSSLLKEESSFGLISLETVTDHATSVCLQVGLRNKTQILRKLKIPQNSKSKALPITNIVLQNSQPKILVSSFAMFANTFRKHQSLAR